MASEKSRRKKSAKMSRSRSRPKSSAGEGSPEMADEQESGLVEDEGPESTVEDDDTIEDSGAVAEPTETGALQPPTVDQTATQPLPTRPGFVSRFSRLFSRNPSPVTSPIEANAAPEPQMVQQVEVAAVTEAEPTRIEEPEPTAQPMVQQEVVTSEPQPNEPARRRSRFGRFFPGRPAEELAAPIEAAPMSAPDSPMQADAQQIDQAPLQPAGPYMPQESEPIEEPDAMPREPGLAEPMGRPTMFGRFFSRRPMDEIETPEEAAQTAAPETAIPEVGQPMEELQVQPAGSYMPQPPEPMAEPSAQQEPLTSEPQPSEPSGRRPRFGRFFSRKPIEVVAAPVEAASIGAPEPPMPEVSQPMEQAPMPPSEPTAPQEPEPVAEPTVQPEPVPTEPRAGEPPGHPSRFGRFFSRRAQEAPQPADISSPQTMSGAPQDQPFADNSPGVGGREPGMPAAEESTIATPRPEAEKESFAPHESLRPVPGQQEVRPSPAEEVARPAQSNAAPPPSLEVPEPRRQDTQAVMVSQVQQAQGPRSVPQAGGLEAVASRSAQPSEVRGEQHAPQYKFVTTYPIYPDNPEVYAGIVKDPETGGYRYIVVEPQMTLLERQIYAKITRLLVDELEVDMARLKDTKMAQAYLFEETKKLAKKYNMKISQEAYKKVAYYFTRDYIKLGRIEVLMNDPRIEDVSCDGPKIPLFIWHRDYESIPTNIMFKSDEELNTFASKLAYVSGKHISIANPIVDASLPDGSRIQITYGKEVTRKGSTFTIRKFKGDPITIVDMLKYNTVSPELGAYLWYLIEKRMSMLVAGGTASGKSVPYDERVLVYSSGKQRLVKIGELYDEIAKSSVSRKEREYEVLPADGLETASFDSKLKVKRLPVKSIVRHPTEKTIFRIRTRSGREVRSTSDHSVFTVVGGSVVPYPVSSLIPGMFLAVPRTIPAPNESSTSVDLLQLLADNDHGLYLDNACRCVALASEAIGVDGVAKILGIRKRDLLAALKRGYFAARVSKFTELMQLTATMPEKGELMVRAKTHTAFRIPLSLPINKSLMRLMGYWTAEGMYQKGITLFQLNEPIRRDIIRLSREVFGLSPHANPGDRTRLDVNSTVVRSLFQQLFGIGGGAGHKRIPDIVLEQNNDLLAEFLRGYFTGDGWAGTYIEAITKSRELAQQLQYALARFGIIAMTNPKVVRGRTYHRVLIYGRKNVEVFTDKIGFLNKYQDRLSRTVHTPSIPHTNVDTIPGVSDLMKKALMFKSGAEKKQLWSDWHSYWLPGTGKRIGSQALEAFAGETGAQGEILENILTLAYSDIFWDEVADVEQVPYDGAYVYDLEVPGAQNFVGGSGGLFLHNTTTLNALSMFIPPDQKIVSVEDSVTADAEILLSQHGTVRKAKIGQFIDSALRAGSASTPLGHELARPEGLNVLTADQSGQVFWSRCTALIRHKVCKDFVKVRTRTGRTIEVTADHSLFSLDERGELLNVSGRDISVGTFLVVPRSIPSSNDEMVFELNSLAEFSGYGFKAMQTSNGTDGAEQQLRVQTRNGALSIPARISLDEDLAFLSGLWMADGFYGERTVGFSAGAKDIESRIRGAASFLGVNVTRHSDGVSLLINSKPLKTLFERTLKLTGDDYSRHVPDIFFGTADAIVASFLKGYFTGDGTVGASEIYVESASEQLLRDIQTLLLRFGITLTVGSKRKVGSLGGLGTFRASIVGTAQVAIFARKIGFEQAKQMRKITQRPKASKYYLDPIPLNELMIREIRESKRGVIDDPLQQRLKMGVRRKVISRTTLLDLAELRPSFRGSKAYSLASSGFYFDRVVSIERDTREENVYDLSVPETGRFIANNILCHNTPELNLSHKNWIQSISRGAGVAGEITLFDLLRAAMRQRPDIIIVGEVRGVEAFTLFQAIATGHGGLGTIHADSVEAAINRLTSEPMNVPKSLLGSTLDCLVMQLRIKLKDKSVRRMVHVAEIVGHESSTDQIVLNNAFKWDPVSDQYQFSGRSRLFDKITKRYGTTPDKIRRDLEDRKIFLKWLMTKNIRDYKDLSQQIREFYSDKEMTMERAMRGLEGWDLEVGR